MDTFWNEELSQKMKNTRNYEITGMSQTKGFPSFTCSTDRENTVEAEETLTAFNSLLNPLFESIFDLCLFFLLELRCGED